MIFRIQENEVELENLSSYKPFFSLERGVVAQWVSSVSCIHKVACSNPTLVATQGPWVSPSLVVACITWCGYLR